MAKLSLLNPKEVIRILNTLGFEVVRQKRSHIFLGHKDGEQLLFLIILEIN